MSPRAVCARFSLSSHLANPKCVCGSLKTSWKAPSAKPFTWPRARAVSVAQTGMENVWRCVWYAQRYRPCSQLTHVTKKFRANGLCRAKDLARTSILWSFRIEKQELASLWRLSFRLQLRWPSHFSAEDYQNPPLTPGRFRHRFLYLISLFLFNFFLRTVF